MSVQRYATASGRVRYRARVKSHGRYVATRVFDRKAEAVAWEQDQTRRLRLGEWVDPRRGHVPLSTVATSWLASRSAVKRRTRESDEAAWRNHIEPRFGNWPIGSITTAEVSSWVGGLVAKGLAPATATRALAALRSLLSHAVADGRVTTNVATSVKAPSVGRARREGHALTVPQLRQLAEECTGPYAELVLVLGLPACAGASWRACT
jgi:Phage integrase, N-terminal SAM-like domain